MSGYVKIGELNPFNGSCTFQNYREPLRKFSFLLLCKVNNNLMSNIIIIYQLKNYFKVVSIKTEQTDMFPVRLYLVVFVYCCSITWILQIRKYLARIINKVPPVEP